MKIEAKVGDWLIIICCLLLIPLSWSLTRQQTGVPVAIEITVADKPPVSYPLKINRLINVASELGDSVIEVHDGKVRFLHSPCLGKICILSGWHHKYGFRVHDRSQ